MTARRRARLLAAALLLLPLAACGEENASTSDPTGVSGGGGISSVQVSGDLGKEPKVKWKDSVSVDGLEKKTLITGDGETVKNGDSVAVHIAIGNGVSKVITNSDFAADPAVLTLDQKMIPAITKSVIGSQVGSRLLVAAPPKDAFGAQGNPQLGIGNKDTTVLVIDVLSALATEPSGSKQQAPSWVPGIKESGGTPESFDFEGTPQPGKDLEVATLVEGTGEKTKKGDQIFVNYLGQTYGGKKPFDESYSKGQPFAVTLGEGGVVKGWDEGLVGVPVGSRVVLSLPPEYGYGAQGNPQAGIKGTDTLFFVVDVLGSL